MCGQRTRSWRCSGALQWTPHPAKCTVAVVPGRVPDNPVCCTDAGIQTSSHQRQLQLIQPTLPAPSLSCRRPTSSCARQLTQQQHPQVQGQALAQLGPGSSCWRRPWQRGCWHPQHSWPCKLLCVWWWWWVGGGGGAGTADRGPRRHTPDHVAALQPAGGEPPGGHRSACAAGILYRLRGVMICWVVNAKRTLGQEHSQGISMPCLCTAATDLVVRHMRLTCACVCAPPAGSSSWRQEGPAAPRRRRCGSGYSAAWPATSSGQLPAAAWPAAVVLQVQLMQLVAG
jgi:hypothetical protein